MEQIELDPFNPNTGQFEEPTEANQSQLVSGVEIYKITLVQSREEIFFPKEYGNINACTWANNMRSHKKAKPPITGDENIKRANNFIYTKHLENTFDFSYYNLSK